MLAEARKKFHRVQHAEIYLLNLKVQYKHRMKLPLDMVSKHQLQNRCLLTISRGKPSASLTNTFEKRPQSPKP